MEISEDKCSFLSSLRLVSRIHRPGKPSGVFWHNETNATGTLAESDYLPTTTGRPVSPALRETAQR